MFCNVIDSNDLIDMLLIIIVVEVTGMFSEIFKKLILK